MRLRNIPGADEKIDASASVVHNPEVFIDRWASEIFRNDRPVEVEIGCGKGMFLMEMARLHPEVNYIGIEKFSSVLVRAVEKADLEPLPNLRFLRYDAADILNIFTPGEIAGIYLNFSDPWPKARHAKKRLTHREFLAKYQTVLAPGGLLIQKTDNEGLFDFSLEEFRAEGWEIVAETRDLHRSPMREGNVMTEFERKFTTLGKPVFKLVAKRPADVV
ncbi:MAG: tRNA (guanosine(46)-N7)-methyltransferase TrmB [Lachnospiraceae bacterium]|nr:tRNA (guanosine(46)-N7)-methyltransferase TrmB [Lachnospiraceae bacterium]